MKKQVGLLSASNRRMKIILGVQLVWFCFVFMLGGWWARLVNSQARRIAQLESYAGMGAGNAQEHWAKMQRMIQWESTTYMGLLLVGTAVMFWLYWRDQLRARSIHAFFASLTHELRTPLTSIRLQAESIAEDPSQKDVLARLLEDTARMESQVETTLELARVEGGGVLYPQPLQIKGWLAHFLATRSETSNRGKFSLKLEDFSIEADPGALQIIFRNLIENAHRHSKQEQLQIEVSSSKKGAYVEISFRDNGKGVSGRAQDLGELFQKGATSQGAGVGLYLIRVLMKRMGGSAAFGPVVTGGAGFEARLRFKGGEASV